MLPFYIDCPQCGVRYSTEICTFWRYNEGEKKYIGDYKEPRYCPHCGTEFEEDDKEEKND